jgi:hypothetical protein
MHDVCVQKLWTYANEFHTISITKSLTSWDAKFVE